MITDIISQPIPEYIYFGTLKEFLKRFKPDSLRIRFGENNPYIAYPTKLRKIKKHLHDFIVQQFYMKPTIYGATLYLTLF